MSITNTSKPTTSISNLDRVSHEETWDTNTSTWDTETRTWDGMSSKYVNTRKPKTLGEYTFDEIGTLTIEQAGGAMSDSTFMINTSKPA